MKFYKERQLIAGPSMGATLKLWCGAHTGLHNFTVGPAGPLEGDGLQHFYLKYREEACKAQHSLRSRE